MNNLNLLTIIAEEALAHAIENEISTMGAKGYTASVVSGKGLHGFRDNQWEGENVKIETVVPICHDRILSPCQCSTDKSFFVSKELDFIFLSNQNF